MAFTMAFPFGTANCNRQVNRKARHNEHISFSFSKITMARDKRSSLCTSCSFRGSDDLPAGFPTASFSISFIFCVILASSASSACSSAIVSSSMSEVWGLCSLVDSTACSAIRMHHWYGKSLMSNDGEVGNVGGCSDTVWTADFESDFVNT
jgi:hypothetical protein